MNFKHLIEDAIGAAAIFLAGYICVLFVFNI